MLSKVANADNPPTVKESRIEKRSGFTFFIRLVYVGYCFFMRICYNRGVLFRGA